MKVCPICGSNFSGDEMFCPHDGARLIVADQPAQLLGEELHHLVVLKRLLYKDAFGERYIGEMSSSHAEVKVTVFNQGFMPPTARLEALESTRTLLGDPMPPQLATTYDWSLENEPGYLIEDDPMGPTLRVLLKERGHFDWRTALKITCSLARNLDWMNAQGVVHRALQPEAIHVTNIQKGYTHLSEWALGVLTYQSNPLEAVGEGTLVIASPYTAPELIDGGSSADRRSMIYALGILLYEMLTGKSPFRSEGVEQTLKRHRRERPMKLSMAAPDRDIPPGLDDLFEVMTSKQPDKRFQTLGAVVNALSSLLDDGTSATDFPEPVRADATTDIHKANGKAKKKQVDEGKKKTMLFISADELQRHASEASEVAPTAEVSSSTPPEKKAAEKKEDAVETRSKDADIDDAQKATLQMDKSVLEKDLQERLDKKAEEEQEGASEPARDTSEEQEEESSKPRRRRKKKRGATQLMHQPKSSDDDAKDDAKADATPAEDEDGNGVPVDDPAPTGQHDLIDPEKAKEAKEAKAKIVIDEDFAKEAEKAKEPEEPSIVIDDSLKADAKGKDSTPESKSISGESETIEESAEEDQEASQASSDEDEGAEEKEDTGSKKSSRRRRKKRTGKGQTEKIDKSDVEAHAKKTSDDKKEDAAPEEDAATESKAPEDKASAPEDEAKEDKKDAEADDAKADADKAEAKADGEDSESEKEDTSGEDESDEDSSSSGKRKKSRRSRKPSRSPQEKTERLAGAQTTTKPGESEEEKKRTSSGRRKKLRDEPKPSAKTDAKVEAKAESATAEADAGKSMEFVPLLSNSDNLDETWFGTDTEAAWDREVLMEHTERSNKKVKKYTLTILAVVFFVVAAVMIYLVFIYEPDSDDEEASLDIPQVEHRLASIDPYAPTES